ncbi:MULTISPECIES: Eco57I restriction-modification methylase domain-containing protein [Bacillus]|uniref:Eco57I restriction-modification methylase domain-containing protein n=1 Tax=Bacillus TaxID=1386 RepID=UPI001AE07150|nr:MULTISPECIES: N-6 DNA methylase [Bacillus]MEC2020202.1 N-6 DNA methylase [Bacillus velezensis]QTN96330.1 N-6 DNA methylase [Bacillus sp. LJBV19]
MTKSLAERKETGSHYTSSDLSKYMAKKLLKYAEFDGSGEKQSILDPSCGDGELLKAICNEIGTENLDVIGMDTDNEAIHKASNYLSASNNNNIHLFNSDYLELFEGNIEFDLFSDIKTREGFWCSDEEEDGLKKVDMIIANPPYVRTQVLGADKAQGLGNKFNLKGRVDLYHVFLVAMTKHLKENGLICVITSNRYLTTTGGKDIRKFLDENYEILEVIDLGDTKLFEAAVLPAIFIGRKKEKDKKKNNEKVKFFRIYENSTIDTSEECSSIFEILLKEGSGFFQVEKKKYEVTVGFLKVPEDPKELWVMASKEDNEWSDKVKSYAKYFFGDVFHVRVGIKTTADKVFIKRNWGNLEDPIQPENEVLKPLISSENTSKWNLPNEVEDLKVLYTHEVKNGKRQAIDIEKYPKAKAYLESHKEVLAGRNYVIKAKRNWYEIWVPQNPEAWSAPKVVFPDISSEPKFAVDTNGYLVNGNCYWLSLKNETNTDLLYLAVAIANSKFMTRFHEIEFQNKLYAGRKRYLTQYVKNYPLPDPNTDHSQRLIELGKILSANELSEEEVKTCEMQIENEIQQAFGFS